MPKSVGFLIILLFVLFIPNPATADQQRELRKFCMWKASAAQTIAMNRDFGLEETTVINHFLNQKTEYREQVIVLHLIDKIFGTYEYVTHDTIYSQTNDLCMRNFYIDKTSEVYLSQHLDELY